MSDNENQVGVPLGALAERINAEHAQADQKLRDGLEHARAAGELLMQAKAQVKHGAWLPWLKDNCRFPERTAQAYMRIAREWDRLPAKAQRVADLPYRDALQALAAPKPEPDAAPADEASQPPAVTWGGSGDPGLDAYLDNVALAKGWRPKWEMPALREGFRYWSVSVDWARRALCEIEPSPDRPGHWYVAVYYGGCVDFTRAPMRLHPYVVDLVLTASHFVPEGWVEEPATGERPWYLDTKV